MFLIIMRICKIIMRINVVPRISNRKIVKAMHPEKLKHFIIYNRVSTCLLSPPPRYQPWIAWSSTCNCSLIGCLLWFCQATERKCLITVCTDMFILHGRSLTKRCRDGLVDAFCLAEARFKCFSRQPILTSTHCMHANNHVLNLG